MASHSRLSLFPGALRAAALAAFGLSLCLAAPVVSRAADEPAAANGAAPAGGAAAAKPPPVDWESWRAENQVSDIASLQRGARNFLNYCQGCHSLKYMRYQRMATDLKIPNNLMDADLVPPGASRLEYISAPMPSADAVNWFGKEPPDLSLITRYKGVDYVYQYLKTFYADANSPTGSNNLALPNAAMPDVLSDLEGVKSAAFHTVKNSDGTTDKVFDSFTTVSPGNMTPEEFDGFVRDTVNFLDYVGEPAQVERRAIGIWVVLFLLVLTGFAWMLKREYWKNVH
jgi:ubiquinol-cytochrome c reductase cytochrome c1 subunit